MKRRLGFALVVFSVVALAASPLIGTAAQGGATHQEGVVYDFHAGKEASWNLALDQYWLVLAAGESGARVDVSEMSVAGSSLVPIEEMGGGQVFGRLVEIDHQGQIGRLQILNGSAKVALTRNDLMRDQPVTHHPEYQRTNAGVEPNECVAYTYSVGRARDHPMIRANGTGVQFTLYSSSLEPRLSGTDGLKKVLDLAETTSVVLQGCHPGTGSRLSFVVETLHPSPEPLSSDQRNFLPEPSATVAVTFLVVGAFVRRGLRRLAPRDTTLK